MDIQKTNTELTSDVSIVNNRIDGLMTGDVTISIAYMDGSMAAIVDVINASTNTAFSTRDASLVKLINKDTSIWVKFGSVDTSLLNLGYGDVSTWVKFGSVDTSLLNLGYKDVSTWVKFGSVDTSLLNLGYGDVSTWVKFGSVDTSLLNLGNKDASIYTYANVMNASVGAVARLKTIGSYLAGLKNASYGNGYMFQQDSSLYINWGANQWISIACISTNFG